MENKKTHYRKVFKSEHLGVADLEDLQEKNQKFVFTIKEVKQEFNVAVAGRKGNHNIAYFVEPIKPLVLNSTNSKVVKSFNPVLEYPQGSPFVEDWKNTKVELYIDSTVKMKGEVVGGVRIRPIQPTEKIKPVFTQKNFEKAKQANATIELIKASYSIDTKTEKEYNDYVAKK